MRKTLSIIVAAMALLNASSAMAKSFKLLCLYPNGSEEFYIIDEKEKTIIHQWREQLTEMHIIEIDNKFIRFAIKDDRADVQAALIEQQHWEIDRESGLLVKYSRYPAEGRCVPAKKLF